MEKTSDFRSCLSALQALSHKLCLLVLSLVMIGCLSRSEKTPFFVIGYSIGSYLVLKVWLTLGWNKSTSGRAIPPLSMVGAFLFLQHQGYISVLSANNAINPQTTVLLMGFAFYSLQVLGFMISILTLKTPLPSLVDYLVAVAYFPKFLSGPIESPEFLQRVKNFRFHLRKENWNDGLPFILVGIIFKFLLATHLQFLVDLNEQSSPVRIIASTIAFELQVYFDFGGYSLIAYGLSLIIGLPILLNFRHPFAAKDVPEFWRRWHIGLGRWFHTYVYEPARTLVPSPTWRRIALPMIVFILSAIWHGQTINFLIWGLFHGLAFVSYVWIISRIPSLKAFSRIHLLITLLVGRFFFMDPDIGRIKLKIKAILSQKAWRHDWQNASEFLLDFNSKLGPQGLGVIIIALIVISYEFFIVSEAHNKREDYAFFHSDIGFALGTIVLLSLYPLVPQFGFVYGR